MNNKKPGISQPPTALGGGQPPTALGGGQPPTALGGGQPPTAFGGEGPRLQPQWAQALHPYKIIFSLHTRR